MFQVNGEDVTTATHNHVVELIKKSGNTVTLKVISAPQSPALNGTSSQVNGKLAADKYGSLSRISKKLFFVSQFIIVNGKSFALVKMPSLKCI